MQNLACRNCSMVINSTVQYFPLYTTSSSVVYIPYIDILSELAKTIGLGVLMECLGLI